MNAVHDLHRIALIMEHEALMGQRHRERDGLTTLQLQMHKEPQWRRDRLEELQQELGWVDES